MLIDPIGLGGGEALSSVKMGEPKGAAPFTDVLKHSIQQVETVQTEANQAISGLMVGKSDLHQTMIAIQKADISFQLMMQVRNKIVQAYEEMVRMQI